MFARKLLMAVCAAGLIAGPVAAAAQDKVVFTSSSVSMLNLPIYAADVMGYFGEQKIAPQIVVLKNGGATALAAVLGGNADVYIGAPSSALGAANKGADAVVFGGIINEVALNIVVHKALAEKLGLGAASPILDRFRALKGLKIGVTGAGSATHQIAQYALKAAGLNPERDATIVFVNSNEDMNAAYQSKRIDAVVTASPASDQLIKEGSFLLADGSGGAYPTLKGMAHVVLVGKKRWISAVPERTTRLLTAIQSAELAIHDDGTTAKVRDLVHDKYFTQLDRKVFESAWDNVKPAIALTPEIASDAIQRNIDFLKEFSDQKYTIAPNAVYTNAYLPRQPTAGGGK
jgi:NitT/TauT family transport system substrate-binding protein